MEALRKLCGVQVTEFGEYYAEIASTVTSYEYPPADAIDFGTKDVVGVSLHKELDMGFQVIFRDGDRSKVGFSEETPYNADAWQDKMIPEGASIAKVELYYMKD